MFSMEVMEAELTAALYQPKDIVWVKISSMWWVAEVADRDILSPDVTSGLKKEPLVIVKFLMEDTYEFVRCWENIYHYNCKRKVEFLVLGFKKCYKLKNEKNMAKFPSDIKEAERRTGGDPEIVNDPKYLPVEASEQSKVNGGRSSLPAGFKGKKAVAPRRSAPATSGDGDEAENGGEGRSNVERPPIVKQGPSWYPYPKHISVFFSGVRKPPSEDPAAEQRPLIKCSLCCFETQDLRLLMQHHKYKQHNTTSSQPGKYHWRNPLNKKATTGAKKTPVRRKKDSASAPAEKRSAKKKKREVHPIPVSEFTPPKKLKLSLPGTPSSPEVNQECAKIIEEWTDDDEGENEPSDRTLGEDLLNCSASINDNTMEAKTDEAAKLGADAEKTPSVDTTPQKVDKPSGPPKSSSCFDFDEEEPAEPDLQSSGKFGQIRLPRVITPEKSKPPDPLGDGDDIDSLLKEVSVPEIPSLPPSKQDSLFSRGDRTYGSSPFKDTKKPAVTSPARSDSNNTANADVKNNKNEEKHFLAEGPLQSKTLKSSGRTEGAEDGSDFNKKLKVGTSPLKPSNKEEEIDGDSSKVAAKTLAAEIAKKSLIDTLTYSPRSDDVTCESRTVLELKTNKPEETLLNDSELDKTINCSVPLTPSLEKSEIAEKQRANEKLDVLTDEGTVNLQCAAQDTAGVLELLKSPPSSSRRSIRNKVVNSVEKAELKKSSEDKVLPDEAPEATIGTSDLIHPAPKSSRKSRKDKLMSEELASPEEAESPRSSRRKKKIVTFTEMRHLQSGPVESSTLKADVVVESAESVKSPCAVDDFDSIQSAHQPSRRTTRKKSMSQEPTEPPSVQVYGTSRREASPVEPESPSSGKKNKKLKSPQGMPETHPEDRTLKAGVSEENTDFMKSPSSEPSKDITTRKKTRKLRSSGEEPIVPPEPPVEIPEMHSVPVDGGEESAAATRKKTRKLRSSGEEPIVPPEPPVEIPEMHLVPVDVREESAAPSGVEILNSSKSTPKPSRRSRKDKLMSQEPSVSPSLVKEMQKKESSHEKQESPRSSMRNKKYKSSQDLPELQLVPVDSSPKEDVTQDSSDPIKSPSGKQSLPSNDITATRKSEYDESSHKPALPSSGVTASRRTRKLRSSEGELKVQPEMPLKMPDLQSVPVDSSPKEGVLESGESTKTAPADDNCESVQMAHKPSRKTKRKKSMSLEPTESPSMRASETPKREASPDEPESLRSSKRNKKRKYFQEMPELQLASVDGSPKEDVPLDTSGSMSSPSDKQVLSDLTTSSTSRKLRSSEGEPKVQPELSLKMPDLQSVPVDSHMSMNSPSTADTSGSSPKPSRKTRNKSMSREPTESPMGINETPKKEGSPDEPESTRFSKRSRKFKSSHEMPELQSVQVDSPSKAGLTQDSAESVTSPSKEQRIPSSDIAPEAVPQKTPRSSRKTKKLGSSEGEQKVQSENNLAGEEVLNKVPLDIPEHSVAPTGVATSNESPKNDEPPKCRRSQRNRSQEMPLLVSLPEDCTPKTADLDPKIPQDICKSLESPTTLENTSSVVPSHVSTKMNESPQSSRRSKRLNSQDRPVSILESILPSEENTSKIPESPKLPASDEASCVRVVSLQDSSKVDASPKSSKKSKKVTPEVPVSIPLRLPEKDSTQDGSIIPKESPISSEMTPKSKLLLSDKPLKIGTAEGQDDYEVIKLPSADKTSTLAVIVSEESKVKEQPTAEPHDLEDIPAADKVEPLKSLAVDTALVMAEDSKANEPNVPSRKSRRIEMSTSKSICQVDTPKTESKANEVVRLKSKSSKLFEESATSEPQEDLKPVVSSKDDPMVPRPGAMESSDSKLQPSLSKDPHNVEALVPVENSDPAKSPSVNKVSTLIMANDSKANEPLLPSRKSRRISSQEMPNSLRDVDTRKTETSSSEIPQGNLEPTKLPSCDETLTSKLSLDGKQQHPELTSKGDRQETLSILEESKPLVARVASEETFEDFGKNVADKKGSPEASDKKIKSVLQEPKSLPDVTPKPDDILKKVSSVVGVSRSRSKEAKSKNSDKKSPAKSLRHEKSGRESRSASKEAKDKGSQREEKSGSELKMTKKERTAKEKRMADEDDENCQPRLKPAVRIDVHSKDFLDASISSIEQVPSGVKEKLESPESFKGRVAKDVPLSQPKDADPTPEPFYSSSPRKKKSKLDLEVPKVEEPILDPAEMSEDVKSSPGSSNLPSQVKPLEITVFDCSKNEIVVDTDLAVSSPKKQMAHSPSKTFRQDEAASLLEELLGGSSPKSSPTSSPKKAKAVSPVKVTLDSSSQKSQTADIKFSLSPSKVLDFGSPSKADDAIGNSTNNLPLSVSKSPTDAVAAPAKASRWDSPIPLKSTGLTQASPVKIPSSPGNEVNYEFKSGLGWSRFKSPSPENSVAQITPPKLPVHLEPDSSNNQSDDELSALQAEILSYSAMDKERSVLVPEVKKEVSDIAKELEDPPNSLQPQTSAPAAISSSNEGQGKKESSVSPNRLICTTGATSHVIPQQPEPVPPLKPSSLSEADLLASLGDAIIIPLNEPVPAESVSPVTPEKVSSSKPSNTPILITVPSDSPGSAAATPGSAAINVVGTERLAPENSLSQAFGSGADLLDINSMTWIMQDDFMQDDSMMTYSEAPVTATESNSSTAVPIVVAEPVSSISLGSVKSSDQLPPVSMVTSSARTASVTTMGSDQPSSVPSFPTPPVHSIPLPPEPSVQKPPEPKLEEALNEEIIETEIVMDHSETEQDCLTAQAPEEKFAQALVKQPWLRPDLLDVLTKGATEKKVYEAKKVTQLVISLYDEDHPDYSYYMSLPPCQVGTSNSTPSWAAAGNPKASTSSLVSSTNPSKNSLTKATSANSRFVSSTTNNTSAPRTVLSVDKSKSIVTVARPDVEEVILADSSSKPLIVGPQSLTIPIQAVRQSGASPSKAAGSQLKQQILQLMTKAQSGELDAETTRKLNALTMQPDFMARINKQQKPVVSSRPSAEVKVQPRNTSLGAKTPIVRVSPTAKIITSMSGSPTVVSQSAPIVFANVSSSDARVSQPKPNLLAAATRGTEPLKFTMDSKFRNIQIANNSPTFVVACDPVTGVPSVKTQIVIGRNANVQPVSTVSAGVGRSTILTSQNSSVVSPGSGRNSAQGTIQTFTMVSPRSSIPSATQSVTVASPGLGRSTVPSKVPGSSVVKVATALPQSRPRLVQRMKTIPQPNVVPSAKPSTQQTVRVRKQSLPGQPASAVRQVGANPETITYVTITNNAVVPTSSEQVYVMSKKPSALTSGTDLIAEALAGTDILTSESESFTDPSPDLFNPASSVVIAGSLGADQLPTISFDPAETDNVKR